MNKFFIFFVMFGLILSGCGSVLEGTRQRDISKNPMIKKGNFEKKFAVEDEFEKSEESSGAGKQDGTTSGAGEQDGERAGLDILPFGFAGGPITTGTRQTFMGYNADGFLDYVTDPEGFTTMTPWAG